METLTSSNPNDTLTHWKYIKREKVNGKWRYWYPKDNMYDTDPTTYEENKKKIMASKEWQDIVKRRDPEYVYVDENGQTQYRFDDYLLNKKHPLLDALGDIAQDRKVSILEQSMDTVVAAAKDYVNMGISAVNTALSIGTTILSAKIKNQQGSYEKQKQEVVDTAKTAVSTANATLNAASNATKAVNVGKEVATDAIVQAIIKGADSKIEEEAIRNAIKYISQNVSEEDIRKGIKIANEYLNKKIK